MRAILRGQQHIKIFLERKLSDMDEEEIWVYLNGNDDED